MRIPLATGLILKKINCKEILIKNKFTEQSIYDYFICSRWNEKPKESEVCWHTFNKQNIGHILDSDTDNWLLTMGSVMAWFKL